MLTVFFFANFCNFAAKYICLTFQLGQKNKMVEVLGNSKIKQNVKYIGVKS